MSKWAAILLVILMAPAFLACCLGFLVAPFMVLANDQERAQFDKWAWRVGLYIACVAALAGLLGILT